MTTVVWQPLGGQFRPATLRDYADDASAAVDFLAKHSRVDASKIGLLGHSEGGNLAPMLAAERNDIAFLILMAAPGVSNLAMNLLQLEYIYQDEDPESFDRDVPHWRKIYKAMAHIADRTALRDSLEVLFDDYEAAIENDEEFAPFGGREAFKKSSVARHSSLWYHDFLQFDGQNYLKKLQIPILALNGTRDHQVDAEQNLGAMEALFKANGNTRFKALRIEGTSHFIQHCKTCNLLEMYFLLETFSQKALDEIGAWLRKEKVLQ
jgi:pimeloyl-ACP methyl ester carboxylesterase